MVVCLPRTFTAADVVRSTRGGRGGHSSDLIVRGAGVQGLIFGHLSHMSSPCPTPAPPLLVRGSSADSCPGKASFCSVSLLSMKKPWAGGRGGTCCFFPPEMHEHAAVDGASLPLLNRWWLMVFLVPHALLSVGNTVIN